MLKVLDLFSGVGGFSLGLERTGGFKTVAFCEIEPFPRRVLAKHWPEVPIYHDVRQLTAAKLTADGVGVDVVCGGFPCTDISVAGRGAGIKGKDSGLWSEFARLIGELRPCYAIVENVSALLSRGLTDVLGDLAALGYDAEWHCIPASAIGAPHRRDRIWIIAHAARGERGRIEQGWGPIWRGTDTAGDGESGNAYDDVAHPISGELRHESGGRNGASWAGEAIVADDGEKGIMANADEYVRLACRQDNGSEGAGRGDAGGSYQRKDVADAQEQSEWAGLCTSESTEFGWRRFSNGSGENAVANTDSGRLESIRLSQHDEQQGASRRQPDGCGEERRREGAIAAQCGDWWLVESRMGDLADGISAELAGRRLGSIWDTEPDVPRVAHGVKGRVDRLKALGNAVVPQIPELIGRAILAASMGEP